MSGAFLRSPRRRIKELWLTLYKRLHNRPDSEHEMMINRLVFSGLVILYASIGAALGESHAQDMLNATGLAFSVYYLCSLLLFIHIVYQPGISPARRYLAIVHDIWMISYAACAGGEPTAFFYPLYLWTIFGNGFRFGVTYLKASMVVSIVGFSIVLYVTGFWASDRGFSCGLIAGLLLLPMYVSRLILKLSEAIRQAEEASRAKSLFLASVSHELRTPLNAIIGLSDLMQQEKAMPRDQADMVKTIGTAGRWLLGLINSILDFSRLEAKQMPTKIEAFDLHELLRHVEAMLSVQANAKGIRFSVHYAAHTPRIITGDRRHLEEVLVNLGGNAVKFTAEGQVVIGVMPTVLDGSHCRLHFEVSDTGIGIAPEAQERIFESFTQADETIIDRFGGTGLGLAICKQLVELQGGIIGLDSTPGQGSTFWFDITFKREEDETATRSMIGRAIALSSDPLLLTLADNNVLDLRTAKDIEHARTLIRTICAEGAQEIVLLVDENDLDADTDALKAAEFLTDGMSGARLSLIYVGADAMPGLMENPARGAYVSSIGRPLDARAIDSAMRIAGERLPEETEAAVENKPTKRRFSVLVAEDNRTNQLVIAKILERAGHEVTIVSNGELALDAMREIRYDVVLMDINMPVMNGIEATKLYRFISLGQPRVPIVALTADATPEIAARCEAVGMEACVTKPIEPARLLELLEAIVSPDVQGVVGAAPIPEGVTPIAAHPRFAAETGSSLNLNTLEELEQLGGFEFVDTLVRQFINDGAGALRALQKTVAEENVQAFRDHAHALRSSAANVGAQKIFEMCLEWRQLSGQQLAENGERHMRELEAEFKNSTVQFTQYLTQKAEKPTRAAP